MLSHSVVSDWDLSPAKTHTALVSGPNEAQVLGVSLQKKNSVRDTAIGKR